MAPTLLKPTLRLGCALVLLCIVWFIRCCGHSPGLGGGGWNTNPWAGQRAVPQASSELLLIKGPTPGHRDVFSQQGEQGQSSLKQTDSELERSWAG